MITIRAIQPADRPWLTQTLKRLWGATQMVSRGRLFDLAVLPGFLACDGAEIVGIVTYRPEEATCEISSINALRPRQGIGRQLLAHMAALGKEKGWQRLWLITTNDNLPAQRFYESVGWRLAHIHHNAIAQSRLLKPEIPLLGLNGVPLEDEYEYELRLTDDA
ncbi:MAG: GNAT family N-acetyltransferase [Anaerolineales bacterium]|nr:GNAT family N-acetyltransferase [Anaerolineales bacterium]MCB0005804.1 GNAT family N-acetyltransferase [Anaerolineales bacterium]MCB0014691.1 GNAT family N-acetyltransferase [Anaerolineales bacterium]MCB8960416.1 GNAT family N-acetyltransferase [Ardenticatenales bacterium]